MIFREELALLHGMPVHDAPCEHCPTAHHPPDPESADVLTWPRDQMLAVAFPCGWRNDKLCRGQSDEFQTECEARDRAKIQRANP